jgi:hypothetical protein
MNMEWLLLLAIVAGPAFILIKKRSDNQSSETQMPSDVVTAHVPADNFNEEPEYNDNYWFPVESVQRQVSAHLRLKYTNTANETSGRDFDVSGFSRGETGYHIHGYCHKKKKKIILSSIGMSNVIDLETGEEIADVNPYLEARYKKSDGYLQDLLFDEYGWAIYTLLYLAASSGSVVKKEREVISQFIKSLPKYSSLDSDWIDAQLKKLYRPGKMEVRNWVKEGISGGNDFTLIETAVAELESFQKEENKEFWTFKRYIQKQVNAASSTNA